MQRTTKLAWKNMLGEPAIDNSKIVPGAQKARPITFHIYTLWLFTCNDFKVIVWPQTMVGIFNALTGALLTTNPTPSLWLIISRFPFVFFWNWFNLLTFNLANQRLESSIIEDELNKPFRPIPSKRISPDEARQLLLSLIPIGIAISAALGGLQEAVAMIVLTWMYNDLGGADNDFRLRNLINAGGFICHTSGSTLIAAGFGNHMLTQKAEVWLLLTGAVVFSTLQVQDLPDMRGDAIRGRRTLPLVYGEWVGRCSVAFSVLVWSVICPWFWDLGFLSYFAVISLGLVIGARVITMRYEPADQTTYKIWCLWLIGVYALPLVKNHGVLA